MRSQQQLISFAACVGMAILPAWTAAAPPTREEAVEAMHRAVRFFRAECSAEGGYVYRLSADLTKREGEGKVGMRTAWVQPPGTPAVGMAYLTSYRLTGDPLLLEAALETAEALRRGQLVSGGWMSFIEYDPQQRTRFAYRVDGPEAGERSNWTTFDDDKSQSAIRFLAQLDQTLHFKDAAVHECAMSALDACVKSQYPNGAWPQRYREFPDPNEFPVLAARFPETWSREFPGEDYRGHYTLNDNTISDLIETMLLAWDVYGEERFLEAAKQGGVFLLLAQLPEPQPGWAQQYDRNMQPAWARKFEPPALTGGESQGVMRTLLLLSRRTGDCKYAEPIPRALAYYRRSLLPDGRLARFYELGTNKPLYFTKDYELTYDDGDLPTHYGFKTSSRLDRISGEFEKLKKQPPGTAEGPPVARLPRFTPDLEAQTAEVIALLDGRGAWVEEGRLSYHGDSDDTRRVIQSATFSRNLTTLAEYVVARGADDE